jgi:hypothetical protein
MVKRNGKWVRHRKASSPQKAKKEAAALNINVTKKEG